MSHKIPISRISTLGELQQLVGILPKIKIPGCRWRMLPETAYGSIKHIPKLTGFAVATDGIRLILITYNTSGIAAPRFCTLSNFQPFNKGHQPMLDSENMEKKRETKRESGRLKKLFEMYCQ